MKLWLGLFAILLTACTATQDAHTPESQVPPSPTTHPAEQPPKVKKPSPTMAKAPKPALEKMMISSEHFQQAHQAFTTWAQETLKTKDVKVLPDRMEGISKRPAIGVAIAFEAFPAQGASRRGWANTKGQVALSPQTLGPLVEASGLWTDDPKVKRTDLAKALVWSMGKGYRMWMDPTKKAHPPRVKETPGGDKELVFFVAHRRPGPGGAGGGPEQTSRCDLSVTSQGATLTTTSFP